MQLHETAIPDPDWMGQEMAASGTTRYIIVRMLYNFRLQVVEADSPQALHSWCFKTSPHAVAALAAWDPDTQDEPLWWHKRAGLPRRAPRREENIEYNLPRCTHGSYIHEERCDIDPFCREMPHRQGSQRD